MRLWDQRCWVAAGQQGHEHGGAKLIERARRAAVVQRPGDRGDPLVSGDRVTSRPAEQAFAGRPGRAERWNAWP